MKKITNCKRMLAALLGIILLLGTLPTSTFAATECGYIGIRGCAIPKAGAKPDFDVEENWPSQYTIMTVNWYKGSVSAANAVGGTDTFQGNTVYIVEFEVWAKSGYSFTTDTNGYTTVEADVSPNYAEYGEFDAQVYNVYGKDNTKYLTVRYTFPKTESTATILNSIAITGVDVPRAGDRTAYPVADLPTGVKYYTDSKGYYYDVAWYDGTKKLSNLEYFEEGKTYVCHLSLRAAYGYEFATDPNVSTWPTVSVTVNGKSATVVPDYSQGSGSEIIIVAAQFVCEPSRQITHVDISGVTEPKTGAEPKYFVACGDSTYERHSLSNVFYAYGVAWLDGKDNLVTRNKDLFQPSTAYTVSVTLKPTGDYIFAADAYGRPLVTATVNGKEAEVHKSSIEAGCIEVTYKFRKTDSLEVSKVEVNDLEEPKSGNLPDYSVTYGDTTYAAQNYSDEFTVNGVLWYNDTTGKDMRPGIDKFEGGNTYCVYIFISTTGMHTFKYVEDTDSWTVSAKLNGKNAGTEEVYESDLTVWYQFTLPEDVHVCTLQKIEEVKANCTADGKKAYYVCSDCGKYYEDSKASKEISDISAWGVIAKLEHTGGKATCDSRAICKNCGEYYGELVEHNFGKTWDYKDANGHAHTCKVCGINDTVVPHSGGTAKCGESAKCAECKTEYGEVMQHQWSKTPEYTDKNGHAYKCILCGERDTVQAHSGGTADCQNKAKCSVCGTEYGKTGDHVWSTAWEHTDSKGHAHKCTVCGDRDDIVKHTPGTEATETSPQTCTACAYVITPAKEHKHTLSKIAKVDASCTTAGKEQHYICDGCGKLFSDAKGKTEITDPDSIVIPAAGHKDSKWKSDADVHWKECTVKGCGTVTVEKEAHEFNKSGKCTVCSFKSDEEPDSSETTDTADEQDTTLPDNPDVSDAPDITDTPHEDTAPTSGGTEATDPEPDGKNNTGMWIALIASGITAVAFIIIVTVVLAKKGKRNE